MKIMIHSNAPWVPTGYGLQTQMLMEQLTRAGYLVAVSAFSGLSGADIVWQDHQIMPAAQMAFGVDVLIPHLERFGADLVITLMDLWKLEALGESLRTYNIAAWLPVDCSPLSRRDLATLLTTGIVPIAMSRFGQRQIAAEMEDNALVEYVPHAVNSIDFAPMDDRTAYRTELGIDDKFVIGLCAANKDSTRKGFSEQFEAFAKFHHRHAPNSLLLVHSTPRNVGGLDLWEMITDFGLVGCVRFSSQYGQDSGLITIDMMRRWYSALDVLSLCSYAEGFGVPLIEAQACGTPVITTNGSATAELVGPGWLVEADPFYNPVHRAWWRRPRIESITRAYLAAYKAHTVHALAGRRERARDFALRYDSTTVFDQYWKPTLRKLGA